MSKKVIKPFGYSLLADIYNCSRGLGNHSDDLNICYKFLNDLPGLIGMEKQGPPVLIETDANAYPDKAGYSGWVALVESGIQLHTLVPGHFITIDIYSCQRFDPRIAMEYIRETFQPYNSKEDMKGKFLLRGETYYQNNFDL